MYRKTKRTYYKYICRVLVMALAILAAGLIITTIKLDISMSLATAHELEYEARIAEANRAKSELMEQLLSTTAPVESEPSYRKYLGEFIITYYCSCSKCCGKADGITASGAKVREGVTVAVDPMVIPLGTYLYIEGIGYRVAQDTGASIKGNRIDVYMNSHDAAKDCGVDRNINVWRLIEND